MTFISHAQNCEDVILWRALKEIESGFYVDVGAAWPTFHSVTKDFYDRGWHGINVEPNLRLLHELNLERPRDLNLGVVIGEAPGEAQINVMSNAGLSTVVESIAENHIGLGFEHTAIKVPMTTLAAICEEHIGAGKPIHFLKVDVEGFETAALRGNDWTRFRPWIVVVEAMEPMKQIENHQEWENIILEAKYSYVYTDGLNRYYLADEHKALTIRFQYPPNIFDDYMQVEMQTALMEAEQRQVRVQALQSEKESLTAKLNEKLALEHYQNARSAIEAALFHFDGRPRKLIRRICFHSDGRCRKLLHKAVFHRDGRARKAFRLWLSSEKYRNLPCSIQI